MSGAARFDLLAAQSGSLDTSGTGGGASELLSGICATIPGAPVRPGPVAAEVEDEDDEPLQDGSEGAESSPEASGDGSGAVAEPSVETVKRLPRSGRGARA